MHKSPTISIIIPVYNEIHSIEHVFNELLNFKFSETIEIVVVDDGSNDGTDKKLFNMFREGKIKLISHSSNKGYGAALKTGIRNASGSWVVCYDGDGQFEPVSIERFWKIVQEKKLDAAIGSREGITTGSYIWRAPGKLIIRFIINRLVSVRIKDFNCGFRMVRREVILKYLHLCSDKFSFSTTSTLILINRGYDYAFEHVNVRPRIGGSSSVKISSGFSTINLVLKAIMFTEPMRIFLPLGYLLFLSGFLWGAVYFSKGFGLSTGSLFLLISSILFVFLGLIADQIAEIRKSQFER